MMISSQFKKIVIKVIQINISTELFPSIISMKIEMFRKKRKRRTNNSRRYIPYESKYGIDILYKKRIILFGN